jgi:hypothetical protein
LDWRFVRIIDPREVFYFATSGFGVHAFAIAPLTFVNRCVDKNFDKSIIANQASHLIACSAIGTYCRANNGAVMFDYFRGYKTDATDICVPIFLAKAQTMRKMVSNYIAIQNSDLTPELLK